jgi:hypothetical protein
MVVSTIFVLKPWWSNFGTLSQTSTTTNIFHSPDEFPPFSPKFDHFKCLIKKILTFQVSLAFYFSSKNTVPNSINVKDHIRSVFTSNPDT